MKAKLLSAWGYQGDALDLPVADIEASATFYIDKMGFEVLERSNESHKRLILKRDGVQMGLAENGRDPQQDGCAFHTNDVAALRAEFAQKGLQGVGEIREETREDGSKFDVFFVVAPDGLCFWFGQRK